MLMEKCGDFLRTKMSTPDDVFNFLLASHSNFPDGKTELLMELLRANAKRSNCKARPCLVGQDVLVSHSSLFCNGMVVAKKQPISDGTCGFPCNQPPSLRMETPGPELDGLGRQCGPSLVHAGLAVVRLSDPRHPRRTFQRASLPLQCITHQTLLSHQQGYESRLLNPCTGLAEFVFACGVANQLSWQSIMG